MWSDKKRQRDVKVRRCAWKGGGKELKGNEETLISDVTALKGDGASLKGNEET